MILYTASQIARPDLNKNMPLIIVSVLFLIIWIFTLAGTTNTMNWLIENTLTFIFLAFLILTYKTFRFSTLSYVFIAIYLSLHVYGSEYTYAENPFGYWLKDVFHFSRNHYDRLVHFSFGFLLAYPMRDYFMNKMKFPAWVCWTLPVEITISFSCLYEIIEWVVADVFFPKEGDAYLGLQGDIWDSQKDMFMALCGALSIILITLLTKRLVKK
jgi:putative membrane protein